MSWIGRTMTNFSFLLVQLLMLRAFVNAQNDCDIEMYVRNSIEKNDKSKWISVTQNQIQSSYNGTVDVQYWVSADYVYVTMMFDGNLSPATDYNLPVTPVLAVATYGTLSELNVETVRLLILDPSNCLHDVEVVQSDTYGTHCFDGYPLFTQMTIDDQYANNCAYDFLVSLNYIAVVPTNQNSVQVAAMVNISDVVTSNFQVTTVDAISYNYGNLYILRSDGADVSSHSQILLFTWDHQNTLSFVTITYIQGVSQNVFMYDSSLYWLELQSSVGVLYDWNRNASTKLEQAKTKLGDNTWGTAHGVSVGLGLMVVSKDSSSFTVYASYLEHLSLDVSLTVTGEMPSLGVGIQPDEVADFSTLMANHDEDGYNQLVQFDHECDSSKFAKITKTKKK